MYMQIRMPLACLLILLYAFQFYRAKKRLKTHRSRVFAAMSAMACVHLVAAVVTEYTVNNRDQVPELFNYVWHIIFLVSITWVCALLYFYLLLYVERGTGKPQRLQMTLALLVCGGSTLGELVLPIEYVDTIHGSYSLGPKAYALYVTVVFTILMMIVTSLRHRRVIGRDRSNVLLCSVLVFLAIACIQIAFPYILLTDLGVTMIILGIMVNTEDAHMYISYQTGLYNELGCTEILRELLMQRRPFEMGLAVFLGADSEVEDAMSALQRRLPERSTRVICGCLSDNVLAIIPMARYGVAPQLPELKDLGPRSTEIKYQLTTLRFTGEESVEEILLQAEQTRDHFEEEALYRDDLTGLMRRAAFSRLVEEKLRGKQPFTFLMIDMDDFKSINDTYGHSIGDDALRFVADSFREVLRSTDLICRMGGDEFAVALSGIISREQVLEITQRLSRAIRRGGGVLPDTRCTLQLSYGARIFDGTEDAITFRQIYVEADGALYRAKAAGGDRTSFARSAA